MLQHLFHLIIYQTRSAPKHIQHVFKPLSTGTSLCMRCFSYFSFYQTLVETSILLFYDQNIQYMCVWYRHNVLEFGEVRVAVRDIYK